MSVFQVNFLLSILVVIGQFLILALIINLFVGRKRKSKLSRLIIDWSIPLAFAVALVATLGSLYYSEIAQFSPCKLCWFQRIFIYPQIIILGLAWWKKDRSILDYGLALILVGGLISLYHNYIYYAAKPSLICSVNAPCVEKYVTGFGYITIPLMALTSLVIMGLLLLSNKIIKK